jgi:hypothetical protein
MKITTQKIGGIWHGYFEGHPEVDERTLTEEIAREKVQRIAETGGWKSAATTPKCSVDTTASSRKGTASDSER